MPNPQQLPQRLPRGVSPSAWQYVHSNAIAAEYEGHFSQNVLFDFDQQVLARYLARPGLVIDLGCGTGRSLVPLARRGFSALGIDLSLPMLRIAGENAHLGGVSIGRVRANLVELDCIKSGSADYCISMFSTLGMIRRRENRHRVLAHVRRILKPGGRFVVHVHNLWYTAWQLPGARWLVGHLLRCAASRSLERGDKYFDYRGIRSMFLHTFTRRELLRDLSRAGLTVDELIPLDTPRRRALPCPSFFGWLRANGWIAVCRAPNNGRRFRRGQETRAEPEPGPGSASYPSG